MDGFCAFWRVARILALLLVLAAPAWAGFKEDLAVGKSRNSMSSLRDWGSLSKAEKIARNSRTKAVGYDAKLEKFDQSQRISFEGFSVRLPASRPWFIDDPSSKNLVYFGSQLSPTHTFQAMVRWKSFVLREFFDWEEAPRIEAESSEKLDWVMRVMIHKDVLLEQWIANRREELLSARFQAKSFDNKWIPDEPNCWNYHAALQDVIAPNYSGPALIFEVYGKVCFDLDPTTALFVDVSYGERRLLEEASSASFKSEGVTFLRSLLFEPASR